MRRAVSSMQEIFQSGSCRFRAKKMMATVSAFATASAI
jgi:hypothetical protein